AASYKRKKDVQRAVLHGSATEVGQRAEKAVSDKYATRMIVDLPCLEKVKRDPVPLPKGDLLGRLLEGLPYRLAAQRHTEEIRLLENAAAPAASEEPPGPRLPTITRLIATTTLPNLGEF
ncbi:unnamed protein product, partial [Ixodes hexagonus]